MSPEAVAFPGSSVSCNASSLREDPKGSGYSPQDTGVRTGVLAMVSVGLVVGGGTRDTLQKRGTTWDKFWTWRKSLIPGGG